MSGSDWVRLKLCEVCDQVSVQRKRRVTSTPRCNAPVPPAGAPCRSSKVLQLTVYELNSERAARAAELTDHRTRIRSLETELRVYRDETDEKIEDLQLRVGSLEKTILEYQDTLREILRRQ